MRKIETKIFNECLSLVLDKGEALETAVGKFPGWEDVLLEDVGAVLLLKESQPLFKPRPGFIGSTRSALIKHISIIPAGRDKAFASHSQRTVLRFSSTIIIGLILLVFGCGLTFSAGDSHPGDGLYDLRRVTEGARIFLAVDPVSEAKLHQQFAQEYMVSCAVLVSQNRLVDANTALQNYENHIARMGYIAGSLPYQTNPEYLELFNDFNQEFIQNFMVLKILLPGTFG